MKLLLVVVAIVLLLLGGGAIIVSKGTPPKSQTPSIKAVSKRIEIDDYSVVVEVEIDGHQYLMFRYMSKGCSAVHKANCSGCLPKKPEKE